MGTSRLLKGIAGGLFVLSLPVLFGTLSLRWLVSDVGWYEAGFQKYGVSSRTGVSPEDLSRSASHMSSYLLLERDDIDIMVNIGGQETHLFNQREITHMVDVRNLFATFYGLMVMAAGYVLVYVVAGRALWGRDHWRQVGAGLRWGGGATLAVFAAVAALSQINFGEMWTRLHLILFDNDLWMLDPSRDRLIMMVPQGFWYDSAIRWGLATGAQALGAILLGSFLTRKGTPATLRAPSLARRSPSGS